MDKEQARYDIAMACAQNSLDFLRSTLRRCDEQEVFDGLFARALASLEVYETQTDRRLTPGKN